MDVPSSRNQLAHPAQTPVKPVVFTLHPEHRLDYGPAHRLQQRVSSPNSTIKPTFDACRPPKPLPGAPYSNLVFCAGVAITHPGVGV